MTVDLNLPDADYILSEGSAWFTLKGFSIRVSETDDGMVVSVYARGREWNPPIADLRVSDEEAAA